MPGITALTILLTIFAIGELMAKRTKAIFSTVLGVAVLLLAGFWMNLLPATIFQDSGVDDFGNIIAGIMLTSLGTTIDFNELKQQWKVVIIAFLGVMGAVIGFYFGGVVFSLRDMALAGVPVFAGGSAATLIITSALKERSMEEVSVFCLVLYVMQKFIGVPVASLFLRREAKYFRSKPENIVMYSGREEKEPEHRVRKNKFLKLSAAFARPSVYLAKLALVTTLAYYLAKLTHGVIHYFVMCLVVGIVFFSLGFLEKGILQKTQANGLITFLVTIIIFANLADTTPAQVAGVLLPLLLLSLFGVAGVTGVGALCSRVLHVGFGLSVAMGISCTFGFPTTMLMPQEIAQAIGETEEEQTAIENYLMPKMLTAGLVTVTIASVMIAGVVVNVI